MLVFAPQKRLSPTDNIHINVIHQQLTSLEEVGYCIPYTSRDVYFVWEKGNMAVPLESAVFWRVHKKCAR